MSTQKGNHMSNINNNPNENEPEKAEPQKKPEEIEPIETDKGEKDLPAEAYPTTNTFSQYFKPQSPYEKYISEPDEKWE